MTRRSPAPSGHRAPATSDATNVTASVDDPGDALFGAHVGAYGGIVITAASPEPSTRPRGRSDGHRCAAQVDGGEAWLAQADRVIRSWPAGYRAMAEVLHDQVDEPPSEHLVAVAVRRAKLSGLIVSDGTDTARRRKAAGHLVRVWRRTAVTR